MIFRKCSSFIPSENPVSFTEFSKMSLSCTASTNPSPRSPSPRMKSTHFIPSSPRWATTQRKKSDTYWRSSPRKGGKRTRCRWNWRKWSLAWKRARENTKGTCIRRHFRWRIEILYLVVFQSCWCKLKVLVFEFIRILCF